ncbi:hypothetical protein CDAR_185471 [Caerostris darwini]|uniref:Guanylate cyclase domain-containing protein n=1 Tax=Caerostris darwini TaxID=1538125 RepID=A0AAV4QRX4_9ARAC|nr:hypothetical protein CDAR_185471 [Caerostris darwini]
MRKSFCVGVDTYVANGLLHATEKNEMTICECLFQKLFKFKHFTLSLFLGLESCTMGIRAGISCKSYPIYVEMDTINLLVRMPFHGIPTEDVDFPNVASAGIFKLSTRNSWYTWMKQNILYTYHSTDE